MRLVLVILGGIIIDYISSWEQFGQMNFPVVL